MAEELNASVDGKWAKQSKDAQGNPLMMVNVLAHDLKACLGQWPATEKRYEPFLLREKLGRLFELPMPAAAEYRRPGGAGPVPSHSPPRDYLVRVKGNQPEVTMSALVEGCRSGTGRAGGGDRRKKAGMAGMIGEPAADLGRCRIG